MPLYVNKIFPGLETDAREGLLDVYAFMVGNDVYIEILKVRLSLAIAKFKFISAMVERKMQGLPKDLRKSPSRRELIRKKFAPRREFVEENGAWVVRETGGEIGACLYMVYDSSMKRMHLSPESTPRLQIEEKTGTGPMNTALLKSITEWTAEYFDAPEEDLEFVSGPVPFNDYEIHTVSEYPVVYQMATDLKMNVEILDGTNVLLVNYGPPDQPSDILLKLIESIPDFQGSPLFFVDSGRFVYNNGEQTLFSLDAPFYIINRTGRTQIGIANALLKSIIESDSDSSTPESRLRDKFRLAYYMGRDLGGMIYSLTSMGAADRKIGHEHKDDILRALGVEETAENQAPLSVLCFLDKIMEIYSELSASDSNIKSPFDKRYYTTVKAGDIQNLEMFETLYNSVDQEEDHLLLRSPFNLPPSVLSMFGLSGVADMYSLDPTTSMLTSNLSYKLSMQHGDDVTAPGTTPRGLIGSMMEDAREIDPDAEDRHNEEIIVHSLSSIPACNVPAQNIFDRRDVEFQDIRVILVHDTQNPGNLGGYVSPRENMNAIPLLRNVSAFDPPFIIVNLVAKGMNSFEKRISCILHEVSHFVDDLLVMEGRADTSTMKIPDDPRSVGVAEQLRFWQDYLKKTPTEVEAHAEQMYYYLSMYSFDYAMKNKNAIRRRIISEFSEGSDKEPDVVTIERMKLYNDIFDRAWEMFESDYLVEPEDVPGLQEDLDIDEETKR